MSKLELRNLHKVYSAQPVLNNVSLEVQAGEFITLLGPSGCGKTTALRLIAGLEQANDGTIHLEGQNITHWSPHRRRLGMVFQSYALFPNLNVADNVAFGLTVAGVSARNRAPRVAQMLERVGLAELGRRYPWQISGGQQQRVALARALINEPRVLLLDEPFSALDAKIRVNLRRELRDLQRRLGITTVFVTHDQDEALEVSDRVVVMRSGHIEQIGTPYEIYDAPRTGFVARFVGSLNTLEVDAVAADGRSARVGACWLPLPMPAHAADLSQLGFRPEAVQLCTPPTDGQLIAQVSDVHFQGATIRVQLNLAGTTLHALVFNQPDQSLPQRGQWVGLEIAPAALRCLPP